MNFEINSFQESQSWSGNIKIGISAENPETVELPSCATKMRHGTWIMAGISVLKDGIIQIELYGTDLDTLSEGDRVGVMRTSKAELIFYVNGESQGVAATNIPSPVYAVVDLYGRCVQVSVCPSDSLVSDIFLCNFSIATFTLSLKQHSNQVFSHVGVLKRKHPNHSKYRHPNVGRCLSIRYERVAIE